MVTYEDIGGMIDHSLLKPNLTAREIEEGCRIAHEYRVATVCARPSDVRRAAELLLLNPVRVMTVLGFPHGATTTAVGGIRTLERAIEVRNLGCTRIGATATRGILESLKEGGKRSSG